MLETLQMAVVMLVAWGRLDLVEFVRLVIRNVLHAERVVNNLRERFFVVRNEWPSGEHTMWAKIRGGLRDRSFVRFVGMRVRPFMKLCRYVVRHPALLRRVRRSDVPRPGPRVIFDYVDCIALAMHNLIAQCDVHGLQAAFGGSISTIRLGLRDGLDGLHEGLRQAPSAQVRWPSMQEMKHYAEIIRSNGSPCESIGVCPPWVKWKPFGWVDGTVFQIAKDSNYASQRLHYSGKHKMHCVCCLFVFAPDGRIIWCNLNLPGSTHDNKAATDLVNDFLQNRSLTPRGFCLLGDTAFRSQRAVGNIITIRKAPEIMRDESSAYTGSDSERALAQRKSWFKRVLDMWITKKRQAVEWAINTFKMGFQRLSHKLPRDPALRLKMLEVMVGLHNFRIVESDHPNQVKTVYLKAFQRLQRDQDAAACFGCSSAPSATTGTDSDSESEDVGREPQAKRLKRGSRA